jgi:hypothetical protein
MGTASKSSGASRPTKNHNVASGRQPGGWSHSPHHMSHDDARLLQLGLFSIALRVMDGKRYDYSGDEDPYRNFRFSAGVGVEPWRGALVRMLDKVSRLVRFAELSGHVRVKEESLIDTVADLINYACITFGLIIESLPQEDRISLLARLAEEAKVLANED